MAHESTAQAPATLVPEEGWHFLHLFYRVDRGRLADLSAARREQGIEELTRILGDRAAGGPERLQCFAVPGHKADFGVVSPLFFDQSKYRSGSSLYRGERMS